MMSVTLCFMLYALIRHTMKYIYKCFKICDI